MNKVWYRPEIDGLRALAVLAVILFHAEIPFFSGGFIGVDIFFVISGFLITSIILREIKNNSFSFIGFLERRARRIIPALVTVISVTALIGYRLLLWPGDFAELGKSIFAQSVFLSNIFFLRKTDYFAEGIDFYPLLHMWTLSLEEQFYIFFPVILLVGFTFLKNRVLYLLVGITLLSFFVSVYLVNINPGGSFGLPLLSDIWSGSLNQTAGFYLLSARAWEFLAGAIVAVTSFSVKSRRVSAILSLTGLAIIVFSVIRFDNETAFPGINALLPVAGTILIIISNSKTFLGKMLSLPIMVWLGVLSYSLYLWHWPLFVYAKVLYGSLDTLIIVGVILLSLILSILTYSLVETRFRNKNPKHPSYTTVLRFSFVLIIFCLIGLSMMKIDQKSEVPPHALDIVFANSKDGTMYQNCHLNREPNDFLEKGPCIIGSKDDAIQLSFVLWGDSQAAMLINALDERAKVHNLRGAVFSSNACAPIAGASSRPQKKDCETIKQLALDFIESHNIKKVILVAKWNTYIHQDSISSYHYLIADENSVSVSPEDSKRVFEDKLHMMLTDMTAKNRKINILKQIPVHAEYKPRGNFYETIRTGQEIDFAPLMLSDHLEKNNFTDGVLDELDKIDGVEIFDPAEIFCKKHKMCLFKSEGKILYRDRAHLSNPGSIFLIRSLGLFENTF